MRPKTRPATVDDGSGLPWPLTEGPSVQYFAPDLWAKHHGHPPPSEDLDHLAAMMQARRTYHQYFTRWAADHDMDYYEARRHKVNRRPWW